MQTSCVEKQSHIWWFRFLPSCFGRVRAEHVPQSELLFRILLMPTAFWKINLLFGKNWFPAYALLVRTKSVPASKIRQKNKKPHASMNTAHSGAKVSPPSCHSSHWVCALLVHGCKCEAHGSMGLWREKKRITIFEVVESIYVLHIL